MANLDEDAVDEILYLARTNETTELASYLSELSAQTKRPVVELAITAVDSYSQNTALHYAAANGHADLIKYIFSISTDKPAPQLINAVNNAGNTPLHWAALNGHLQCVELLVQAGADVTIINRAGHDAVFEAEINDKKEVVDWLLGAVEELEKGIAQTDVASFGADEDMGQLDPEDLRKEPACVEDVRKEMEELETGNGVSKDG